MITCRFENRENDIMEETNRRLFQVPFLHFWFLDNRSHHSLSFRGKGLPSGV
jgi:hypothetical protein